jgi:two-component system KDP operon response regulator KdpE
MMVSQQSSVLIVGNEPSLCKVLHSSLSESGFAVEEAPSGEEGLHIVQYRSFDLVLLDMNMPSIRDVEACRWLRELSPRTGIVLVSGRDQEDDTVQALDAGADDYLTKPFRLRELIARLHAVLRRTRALETQELPVLQAGSVAMDLHRRILWRCGTQVHLSPKEFDLLAFMMQNPSEPLTHARLLRSVWGPGYDTEVEYLRSYVRILRKKIETDPARPDYILTEPWVGYRFRNPSDQEGRRFFVAG